jgi:hypothetical protein
VNIPFYHEETVTLQLWADKSYENNWIWLADKVFELVFSLLIYPFLISH